MSHRITSRRAFLGEAAAAGLVLAVRPAIAQVATSRSFPPPGSRIVINESRMAFDEMVLQQGVEISFAPAITSLEITCRKLVLNGDCTLDLRRLAALPEKPPTPPLAVTTPLPTGVNGPNGTPGTPGLKGANGIALKFTIDVLDAANGSLWIRTDGGPGGPGGDGGDGIPGGGLGEAVHHCKDGGTGGDGGPGGAGGDGGDTSPVSVTVGGMLVRPIADAPPALGSERPTEATGHGRIVIFGTPGSAGRGGTGGRGGRGGLGQVCPAEPVDGKPGHPGHNGPPGTNGNPGKVTL